MASCARLLDRGASTALLHSGTIDSVDLYGQEPEALLLRSFVSQLENRTIIDVGAERGSFAEQMIDGGATAIHVIEPEPDNANYLREHFRDVWFDFRRVFPRAKEDLIIRRLIIVIPRERPRGGWRKSD